jgi:hypothetical protein
MAHTRFFRPTTWAVVSSFLAAVSTGCGAGGKADSHAQASGASGQQNGIRRTADLPARTPLTVTLDVPVDGALVASPPGAVALKGTATVGPGVAAPSTVAFALDVSTATQAASTGTCDPGATGNATVLGCEIAAALQVNGLANPATVTQSGVVVFGGDATAPAVSSVHADMTADAGDQPFTAPGAGVATVLQSVATGKVGQFTEHTVNATLPSLGAGLQEAGALLGAGPGKTLVFLASGANGAGPGVASVPFPEGIVVRAFALGDNQCDADGGGFGSLAAVAARGAPGSTCKRLTSLGNLPDVTAPEATKLESLWVIVDGGTPVDISSAADPKPPQDGPATVAYTYVVTGLEPGTHQVCVRATGSDAGGPGSVDACATVTVATVTVAPAEHVSELGTPNQTHTVVATVAAGAAGAVAEVPVVFDVVSGPNTGATGTVKTDASGQAAFTYTAIQHLAGLGTDTIRACFTDAQGTKACATATQTWVDTTPPVPSCLPGPNPGGQPTGSTANGFFQLAAVDAVDPDPQVFLKDMGSGKVFGPFKSGIAIKYTQAPGATPGQEPMAGAVTWHVKGNGAPVVYAKDASNNVSSDVACAAHPGKK